MAYPYYVQYKVSYLTSNNLNNIFVKGTVLIRKAQYALFILSTVVYYQFCQKKGVLSYAYQTSNDALGSEKEVL